MSENPEKESPSWQAGVHVVSSLTTGGTITVPGLLSKKEKEHGGWWAISEHSFRLIERTFDTPALRRKAQAMLVTLHRIANLKGVTTFVAEISDIARDVNYSYCEAEKGIQLLEILNLVKVKRRQIPGTELKAPSEYTVFPPVFHNKTPIDGNHLSIDECSKTRHSPIIPKNSPNNSTNNNQKREAPFSSIREAVDYFQPLFPDIPVKRSLTRLVELKGRGFLTKSYIGNVWLPNEKERWPPAKKQSDTRKNHPAPASSYVYEDPSQDPDLINARDNRRGGSGDAGSGTRGAGRI
jgi:hypothetical protein